MSGMPKFELTGSNVPIGQAIPTYLANNLGAVVGVYVAGHGANQNLGNGITVNATQNSWNGSGFDLTQNNTQGTLLASATRTATVSSPQQTNYNAKGVMVFLKVTVASGTGGLKVMFVGIDPASGDIAYLNQDPTAITGTGLFAYVLYPGSPQTSGATATTSQRIEQATSGILPRTWQVSIFPNDASSYTYSVGYALIL